MITRLTNHDDCEIYIQMEYYTAINHYASLRCKDCRKHIQWLNKWDVEQIKGMGVKVQQHRSLSPNTPKQQRGGWL